MQYSKMLRSSLQQILFALLVASLIIGCDSTGSTPDDPDPTPGDNGAVSFSLIRSANSNLPSDADSASIRVWKPDGGFNLVEIVDIPDPGQETEASLEVPADEGYRAGVLVLTEATGSRFVNKRVLGHGSSAQFGVNSKDTSAVSLEVRPAEVTIELPDSIPPGVTDTISATYGINVPDVSERIDASKGNTEAFGFTDGQYLNEISSSETDSSVTSAFEITGPGSGRDTTYVRVRVELAGSVQWLPVGRDIRFDFFPPNEDPAFSLPVASENKDGTVIITFSKTGNGWKKTRRVVE